MNWSDIAGTIGKAAPMLGTLVGGPAGAAVGAIIASALGTANDPDSVGAALTTNPEALVKLREIEADKSVKLQSLLVQAAATELQTAAADRDSARKMQMQTASRMPAVLATGITLGFFGVLGYLIRYGKPDAGGDALLLLLGSLGTAWTGVVSFYFGTTAGSSRKTELLAASAPVK